MYKPTLYNSTANNLPYYFYAELATVSQLIAGTYLS